MLQNLFISGSPLFVMVFLGRNHFIAKSFEGLFFKKPNLDKTE